LRAAVTGAFGYSGRYITRLLLDQGWSVRCLTGHPDRVNPFDGQIDVSLLQFEDLDALRQALDGIDVLYNTYWIRFAFGTMTFDRAVDNSRLLVSCAAKAGVKRIVHVSITNPSLDSRLPYFSGKAEVERAVRDSGMSYAILRPAVFFGGNDVLINNVAFILRRFPAFGVVPGNYGIQPIHVEDMAKIAVEMGDDQADIIADAAGPETFTFLELVQRIKNAVVSRAVIMPVPRQVLLTTADLLGWVTKDVPLTRDEIEGLTSNLLVSTEEPRGTTRLTDYLSQHAQELGTTWASELERHFR